MITLTLREKLSLQGVSKDEEARGIVEALKQILPKCQVEFVGLSCIIRRILKDLLASS